MEQKQYKQKQFPLPPLATKTLECSSIAEAQKICAEEWGIRPEDVDVNILTEDKKLFGLLGTKMKVEATSCAPVSYIKSCLFVNEILERMHLDLVPELTEDGTIDLVGEDVGIVIGRFGETLKALEYITNNVCHTDTRTKRVYFDAAGYKNRRAHSLGRLAASVAKDVLRTGRPVTLRPMSPADRRTVHMKLENNPRVHTKSIGEGASRRVVVAPIGVEISSSQKAKKY